MNMTKEESRQNKLKYMKEYNKNYKMSEESRKKK